MGALTSTNRRCGAVVSIFLAALMIGGATCAPVLAQASSVDAAGPLLLHYQGRLVDPATGNPKPDGPYQMAFSLYDVQTAGTALWTEPKVVTVVGGLFSTLLGELITLPSAVFDGRDLWLGVTVGSDPEATPRQRVTDVAYAIYARNADLLDGQHAAAFAPTTHNHDAAYVNDNAGEIGNPDVPDGALAPAKITGTAWTAATDGSGSTLDADLLDGQHAAAFAATTHNHDAAYVNDNANEVGNPDVPDGALAPAKITGTAWTAATDGSGSTLDADLLDGQHATAFATTTHNHDAAYVNDNANEVGNPDVPDGALAPAKITGTAWTATNDGSGSTLDADLLDGQHSTAFAAGGHGHFGDYWSGASTSYGLSVSNSSTGDGIQGYSQSTSVNYAGLYGVNSSSGSGVYGYSASGTGVYGATGGNYGVYGISASSGSGVYGRTDSTSGNGVWGYATQANAGAVGVGGGAYEPGYAGYFVGQVRVSGYLTKAGGGFQIDHPLDPQHKNLNHSFVESPEMKNVYDGVITLDANGEAWVELPAYFEALNRDFRYQLTPIGAPAPNLYIAVEIQNNRFKIAGGTPGAKVSWQATGIRHDPWAEAHPIVVEQDKPADQQGKYLHPEDYGQPKTAGVDHNLMHPSGFEQLTAPKGDGAEKIRPPDKGN